jgi:DNA-binding beta-propeller fold protein YncE
VKTMLVTFVRLAVPAMVIAGCGGGGSASGGVSVPVAVTTPGTVIPATVTTLAGAGSAGSADGIGRAATFTGPTSIAVDAAGGLLYVLEPTTNGIRSITRQGAVATVTRNLSSPGALTYDAAGTSLVVSDTSSSSLVRVTKAGTVSPYAQISAGQSPPPVVLGEIAAGANGTVYVVASRAGDLFVVTPAKSVTAQNVGPSAQGVAVSPSDGAVYVVNQGAGAIQRVAPGPVMTIASSPLLQPTHSMTFDPANATFYLTDPQNNRIIAATMSGQVSVFAGSGNAAESDGVAASASFDKPSGIVYDAGAGVLFVTDEGGNTVRQISGF